MSRMMRIVCSGMVAAALLAAASSETWSEREVAQLQELWIGSLEPLPPDPSNAVADDPRAADLGHRLFFDARFSRTGTVSCASCHQPDREFQDGVALAQGVGTTDRRTMPIAGMAHSPWQFWDGRKDSQWAQALGPLESPVEHGGDRTQYAHLVKAHYREAYEAIFGPLPALAHLPAQAGPVPDPAARAAWEQMSGADREAVNRVFVNVGKAIAAYERQIMPGASRFDRYVEGLVTTGRAPAGVLTEDEVAGVRLFIGKAGCVNCHNGPLMTNHGFHNTGVPAVAGLPEDRGRAAGARLVQTDEFNCRSRWSDARAGACAELEHLVTEGHELERAFKVPPLRGVAERAPYMHAGQVATLAEVVAHYDRAPAAPAGHTELDPLRLTARERRQLEAMLRALSAPVEAPPGFLADPHTVGPRVDP
jgi:cytochrome c peroxidase